MDRSARDVPRRGATGGEHQTTEQPDYVPGRFIRRLTTRPKYRRKEQRHLPPLVAPAPVTPLVGGLPSPALLAHLLVSKYIGHLPVYRQEKIFHRAGVHIPRDLLVHWLHRSIDLLEPVARAIRSETLASSYLQVDEWRGATWTGAHATCPQGCDRRGASNPRPLPRSRHRQSPPRLPVGCKRP